MINNILNNTDAVEARAFCLFVSAYWNNKETDTLSQWVEYGLTYIGKQHGSINNAVADIIYNAMKEKSKDIMLKYQSVAK